MSPHGAEALLFARPAAFRSAGTLIAVSRLRAGMLGLGLGMIAELVFYLLTALLFSAGIWVAVNLLL